MGTTPPMTPASGDPEYRGWWTLVPNGYGVDPSKPYKVIYNMAVCGDGNYFHAGADGFRYWTVDGGQSIQVGLDYDTYSALPGCYDSNNTSNDLQFFPWLQARIEDELCVDMNHEFVSGYAVGAAVIQQLNCAFPDKLRATVTTAGWEPGCPNGGEVPGGSMPSCAAKPMAAFYVHDVHDPANSYACITASCSRILKQNGCTNTKCDPLDLTLTSPYLVPAGVTLPVGAVCRQFNGCPADDPVVFCATTNQGHGDGTQWGVIPLFWDWMARRLR